MRRIILIDGSSDKDGDWVMTLADLEAKGAELLAKDPRTVDDIVDGIEGKHLATLIYTSGTTGKPKGVRLLHECWAYCADAIDACRLWGRDDVQYLWLPMSHSFGKVLMAGHIASGSVTAVDGRIPKLVENLAVVRPTIMAAVPRIFEKVYNKIIESSKKGSPLKQRVFAMAVAVGKEGSKVRQQGREPSGLLMWKLKLADRLVFDKVKATFGGRVRYFISGSAPLSREIAEFFHACGILILEGYGLTENSARRARQPPDQVRVRHRSGMPMPGTDIKLAPEDGEILIRSPGVMQGYHNLPEATAEALTADGWLRTGDIGEVDREGLLADHRSQERSDQDVGRQVHRAAVDRGQAQGDVPVHQPGDRPRRQTQLRDRAGHARRRSHDEVGARQGPRRQELRGDRQAARSEGAAIAVLRRGQQDAREVRDGRAVRDPAGRISSSMRAS